jgi:hypothetical protein
MERTAKSTKDNSLPFALFQLQFQHVPLVHTEPRLALHMASRLRLLQVMATRSNP